VLLLSHFDFLQQMFNIFVFTSKGSVLVKCGANADIQWLLQNCTQKMQSRGLDGPFIQARQEDGVKLDEKDLISDIYDDHPVQCINLGFIITYQVRIDRFTPNRFLILLC
jgi:hypothetical protein